MKYHLDKLGWQDIWAGPALIRNGFRVCPPCLDVPNPNGKKPIRFYPDPAPLRDTRPGFTFQQMQSGISGGLVDDTGQSFTDGAGNQIVPDSGRVIPGDD